MRGQKREGEEWFTMEGWGRGVVYEVWWWWVGKRSGVQRTERQGRFMR